MKGFFVNISCCFLLFICGCQEDITSVPVSDFKEDRLVVNGVLTDSLEPQKISVSLVNNLGDSSKIPVNDFSLQISSGTMTYPYYAASGTQLISTVPFQGVYDSTYQIDFCYKGNCYTKNFMMPSPFSISSFQINQTIYNAQGIEALYVGINSPIDQFVRYEVYVNSDTALYDSTWKQKEFPVYLTVPINTGNHVYFLNENLYSNFNLSSNYAVMVKIFSIDQKTAAYFQELEHFMNNQYGVNQYQNPPFYFDSGVYGIVHGSAVDTAIFIF